MKNKIHNDDLKLLINVIKTLDSRISALELNFMLLEFKTKSDKPAKK